MSTYSSGKGISQSYGDNYNDRVQRLFERVGNLQNAVDEQKSSRIKEIENILVELERRLNEIRDNKSDKINYFDKMIKQIQIALEEESDNRQKLENELNSEINALEKNCQRIIEEASKVAEAHIGKTDAGQQTYPKDEHPRRGYSDRNPKKSRHSERCQS